MSQQLNLLPEDRLGPNPIFLALGVWSLVVVLLFAAWGINRLRLVAAKGAEAAAAIELQDAQALVKQRTDEHNALTEEIAALTPLAEAARQFSGKAADLGTAQGYVPQFAKIASATVDGLWLTRIDLARTGRPVRIEGQSLGSDAVLRFAGNLDAQFSGEGAKFTTLDMSNATLAGGGGKPPLTSTRFTLN